MHRREHTVLTPDNVELKEDSERLKPMMINSPLKQSNCNNKVTKGEDRDEKKQSYTCLNKSKKSEITNPNELSQPRTKRRRVLSSAVHNGCHTAKETDTKFPFSPIYKRTRSFHKKTLPNNGLTIQQKSSMPGIEKG